jgi:predicted metal-dependent hydrolase
MEYLAYFEHFDREEYFECHEVLERLWLRDKNRFYQALIQLAVALYHLSRGNSEGGYKLLAAAEEKLREYPPGHNGMDTTSVADWCAECRASLPPQRRSGPPIPFPKRRLTPQGIK